MRQRFTGLACALALIVGTAVVVQGFRYVDMQRLGIADESHWIVASSGLWNLLKQGNRNPDDWWWQTTSVYGNLQQPLPKIVLGALYNAGLTIWGAFRGSPVAPWEHVWDYNATDGHVWNRAHAALTGGHAILARLLSSLLTGVTAWLMYRLIAPSNRKAALFAAWLFVLHPFVLRYSGFAYIDSWYWAFLLLSTCILLGAVSDQGHWYRRMILYGLAIGLASTAKVVGIVVGTAVLLLICEVLVRRQTWPVRVSGYLMYLLTALVIIYGTNVSLWPQWSLTPQVPAEAARFLEQEDLGEVLVAAGHITGVNRRVATAEYPALYGVVGRPLEYWASFLRFKTLMNYQAGRSQHLRREGEQGVFFRLLFSTWFALPFIYLGARSAWRRKSNLHVVIAATAGVHVLFLFLTLIASFERYFIPALIYLFLLAALGLLELLHNSSESDAPAETSKTAAGAVASP